MRLPQEPAKPSSYGNGKNNYTDEEQLFSETALEAASNYEHSGVLAVQNPSRTARRERRCLCYWRFAFQIPEHGPAGLTACHVPLLTSRPENPYPR